MPHVLSDVGLHLDKDRGAQSLLPGDHPELTRDGVLGLPTGCLTYAERYGRAKNFTQRRCNASLKIFMSTDKYRLGNANLYWTCS